ncbi:MAG: methyltransferase [Candidatus Cloacimonetes bacterium]|nr:methyltransferase [Candidatus Cloacimonadota bacterium]
MTSRERVLNAINHKESDRIPLDLGSTRSSGISGIAYNNLKKELGIKTGHTRVFDVVQQIAQVEEPIIERFGIDTLDIGRIYDTADNDWYDVHLSDGSVAQWPVWFKPVKEGTELRFYDKEGFLIGRMPDGATFFDQGTFPYLEDYPDNYDCFDADMSKVIWQKLSCAPWNHSNDPAFFDKLRANVLDMRKKTDKALVLAVGCNLFEWGTYLRRIDNFLMDIYSDPENVQKLLDKLLEKHMATLDKVCSSIGDVVDIICFGDDLGMDTGMFMSKDHYRRFFKPREKLMCEYVHKHSKMHTMLHSCGSVFPIIDDFIDAGFEILNPVQTSARQMNPLSLKREFGSSITFWGGGCNTRSVLNRSTTEEVSDYVQKTIEIFAPGGGFVFNQEHNIMPDVPATNILAMYEAVCRYKY